MSKDKVVVIAYYLRKVILILLGFLIVSGLLVVISGVLTDNLTSEVQSVGISTVISIVLIVLVKRNKVLLKFSDKYKKRKG